MKFIWFIDKDNDIWRFSNDYSYTIYLKRDNYIKNYLRKTIKDNFNNYKKWYGLKEISEADAFLEIYYKRSNYTKSDTWKTTKKGFNLYKEWYSLNEISEGDAFLEML